MGNDLKIVITGIPVYDGEHPLDFDTLTNREYHIIKRLSGYTQPQMIDAWRTGDTDFYLALAVIAVRRSTGADPIEELFWDAPPRSFAIDALTPTEDVPPTSAPGGETDSMPSGASSSDDSAHRPDPSPVSIGAESSDS